MKGIGSFVMRLFRSSVKTVGRTKRVLRTTKAGRTIGKVITFGAIGLDVYYAGDLLGIWGSSDSNSGGNDPTTAFSGVQRAVLTPAVCAFIETAQDSGDLKPEYRIALYNASVAATSDVDTADDITAASYSGLLSYYPRPNGVYQFDAKTTQDLLTLYAIPTAEDIKNDIAQSKSQGILSEEEAGPVLNSRLDEMEKARKTIQDTDFDSIDEVSRRSIDFVLFVLTGADDGMEAETVLKDFVGSSYNAEEAAD